MFSVISNISGGLRYVRSTSAGASSDNPNNPNNRYFLPEIVPTKNNTNYNHNKHDTLDSDPAVFNPPSPPSLSFSLNSPNNPLNVNNNRLNPSAQSPPVLSDYNNPKNPNNPNNPNNVFAELSVSLLTPDDDFQGDTGVGTSFTHTHSSREGSENRFNDVDMPTRACYIQFSSSHYHPALYILFIMALIPLALNSDPISNHNITTTDFLVGLVGSENSILNNNNNNNGTDSEITLDEIPSVFPLLLVAWVWISAPVLLHPVRKVAEWWEDVKASWRLEIRYILDIRY